MPKLVNELPILKVRNLITTSLKESNQIKNISFEINEGETFAILGEMHSGKSNLVNSILGNAAIQSGSVYFQETLALGEKPNLYIWNKKVLEIQKDFKTVLNDIEKSLNSYSDELEESYFKFVENKYFDVKSKQSLSYPDKKNFKISEGENIKDYDVISDKKDIKLTNIETLLDDGIELIYQNISGYNKQKTFLQELKNDNIGEDGLLQKMLETIIKCEKKVHFILSNLIDILKKISIIEEIRNLVQAREYTSISKFYKDLTSVLKKVEKNVTKINETIIEIDENQILLSASLSRGGERKKWEAWLDEKIDSSIDEDELYNLVIIKQLLNFPSIQEIISKNPKYQTPNYSELKELKKMINIINQDSTKLLSERITVGELLNEYIDLNKSILKNEIIIKDYKDYMISQDDSFDSHFNSKKPSRKKVKLLIIESILKAVGLGNDYLKVFLTELSISEKQLLIIAISAIVPNKIISLDESFSHLDTFSKVKAIKLLKTIKSKFNSTFIIAETDLNVVELWADTVAIIFNGKLLELGPKEEIFNDPKHPYTKTLISSTISVESEDALNELIYNPWSEHHDYNIDLPKWTEVSKKHFVYLNNREINHLKKK
ncbi:oligopeptide ABC transporter ATP-binding protein [Entomoplasma ellychniae]|uniref:Oligopeptide ABC transporter ATP-binding protein n=1 Tax=Entomoplasma ellychniae TaxID=2114 RepID=A0A8E2UAY6_9MOLU|nr:ATP-binding cassette domain-containing protein [Entomoplasma ellychniae]PPE04875.1 oligopeptide ABC transporter ATP-binding protein [Entomoplasma ellychniae]